MLDKRPLFVGSTLKATCFKDWPAWSPEALFENLNKTVLFPLSVTSSKKLLTKASPTLSPPVMFWKPKLAAAGYSLKQAPAYPVVL
ncbi:hypothetical protein NIES2101_41580 [Calothrix sp. HK-06]|nr:hypothetical protein NIES2101_41580 [Calothrix sp. HK-06]